MIPPCSHTGTPSIAFDGFRHFTSSTTSGSASLMRRRTRPSASPRQSPSFLILASISRAGESPDFAFAFCAPRFFFFMGILARLLPSLRLVDQQRYHQRAETDEDDQRIDRVRDLPLPLQLMPVGRHLG